MEEEMVMEMDQKLIVANYKLYFNIRMNTLLINNPVYHGVGEFIYMIEDVTGFSNGRGYGNQEGFGYGSGDGTGNGEGTGDGYGTGNGEGDEVADKLSVGIGFGDGSGDGNGFGKGNWYNL